MRKSGSPGRASASHHAAGAPTIAAVAGYTIVGTGFLPEHVVVVRVTYDAEGISDYLTYRADPRGCLDAELPISPHSGALQITATDRRSDPDGPCGLLWSNTEAVRAAGT
jgi:hypothetical protein